MCPVCAKEICLSCYDEWDESVEGEPPGQLAFVVRCSMTKQSQAKRQHAKDQLVSKKKNNINSKMRAIKLILFSLSFQGCCVTYVA